MCGIIGYVGEDDAVSRLYYGLKRMEYRGYDSAGIAIISEGCITVKKDIGRVSEIDNQLDFLSMRGKIGIAHTRWATHGGVTKENAHPHVSCRRDIAVIHNGIIENHQQLKEILKTEGHRFNSGTDSEVIAHVLEKYYKKNGDSRRAVLKTVKDLKGSFAFIAIFATDPNTLIGARKDAPLAIGVGKHCNFLASDILAFIDHTDQVVFLDNQEVAVVKQNAIEVFNFAGQSIVKESTKVAWEAKDVSKAEFAHYTTKEIHEQPHTLKAALYQDQDKILQFVDTIKQAEHTYITACGTSYHAGLILRSLLARLAKIRTGITVSSEFTPDSELIGEGCLVVALSQSGETADLLSAVSDAKKKGADIFSILNVVGSSLDRESQLSLSINCGPEIGVAATKSFTGQLAVAYLLTFTLVDDKRRLNKLRDIWKAVEEVLKQEDYLIGVAGKYSNCNDFYFVGRGLHLPVALEGALKLKELAYNHAEGMAGGELKHGTLALIEEGTPVVALNPEDETYEEMLSNVSEMKARGARIIGISNRPNQIYDEFIRIPKVDSILYPLVETVPLQMLAYHTAVIRQKDPDYPRNLAKSVTVK
jgi:glucosamine--fructose-6-phosphate aminotransferase (isomerizing)